MEPALSVRDLRKTYKVYRKKPGLRGAIHGIFHREYDEKVAVQDISFDIEEGEFVGFLGPNGAGKTTTLKMLAGLLYPTSGQVSALGFTPWERDDRYRRQFALLLGQKNQLWWDLPAQESLELNARIYGIEHERFQRTVKEMSELLDVDDKLNVMVRELSLGERMKMELIASLLHEPKLLFLDEPTIGLDVVSQKKVREFLKAHNQRRKTTIILTSHYMADIEALCERVLIIDHGKLFFDGRLNEIVDRFADFKQLTLQTEEPLDEKTIQALEVHGAVEKISELEVRVSAPRKKVIEVCKWALDNIPVQDLDIEEEPIEEVIGKLFSRPRSESTEQ